MTAWKQFEDRICIALGGRRVLGNRGTGVPDSDENVPFAVEAKHGYGRFQLREAWIEQARRNAKASGKPWLIVQAPKHSRSPVVTLDFGEFTKIVTKAGRLCPDIAQDWLERFWSKVERTDECWIWRGTINTNGYGVFAIDRHPFAAHRIVWMLTRGPIPPQMMVLHHCDNPPCVNPDHLYIGDGKDNMRDRLDRGRNPQLNKTHCKRGHEFTPENTRIRTNGARTCKECERIMERKRQARKTTKIAQQAGRIPVPLVVEEDVA